MEPRINWGWVEDIILKKERVPAGKKELRGLVAECAKKAQALAKPKFATAVIGPGDFALTGRQVVSHLKGADYLCLFVVTIGDETEKAASDAMSKGDDLRGYLLDRIGSFAVESLAEALEDALRQEYKSREKSVSMRFSPGYCDWPIEEQFRLEKNLDFSKAGVRLTESCMMVPKKSISGVVGIGPKDLFKDKKSPCSICDVKDCYYSRSI